MWTLVAGVGTHHAQLKVLWVLVSKCATNNTETNTSEVLFERETRTQTQMRTRNAERVLVSRVIARSENLIGRCSRLRACTAPCAKTLYFEWKTLFQDALTVNRYCTYRYQPLLGANKFQSLPVTHSRASFPTSHTPELSHAAWGCEEQGQPVECMVIKHAVVYVTVAQSAQLQPCCGHV